MERKMRTHRALTWLLAALLAWPIALTAQQEGQPASTVQGYAYTQEQLDQLLAPIALYPDTLLSQILMASTYPLEVVEADRWLKRNSNLAGDRLDEALKNEPWDVSVKSLCHFPRVLLMMDENLQVTTDLGNAFLSQQDQVMDTIQKLRARAYAQGNLKSTEQQRVVVQDQDIIIDPSYPDVVYVPVYDPCWVYGPWWYPSCSPLWFWWPGMVVGGGFFWGPGIFIGPIDSWCGFFWHRHAISVNVNKTTFINRIGAVRMHGGMETWRHDPIHRRGVAYHDPLTTQRFGGTFVPGVEPRRAFRGFPPEEKGRPQGLMGGVERPGIHPRAGLPSGTTSGRAFEQPREGFGLQVPLQPRGSEAFQGFGRSGIESQQHSERGRESMGSDLDGGFRGEAGPRPQTFGGGKAPRDGFDRGGHVGGAGARYGR